MPSTIELPPLAHLAKTPLCREGYSALNGHSYMQNHTSARILQSVTAAAFLGAAYLLGGCASIVHGGYRNISVASQPTGAKVTVTKDTGEVVSHQTTPFILALDPHRGFFKGQSYQITLELDGYQTRQIQLRPEVSGWYFGNILLGGLIGMLIVDPATGSMWNLSPALIDEKLDAAHATLIKTHHGMVVVMKSDVTAEQLARAQRLN